MVFLPKSKMHLNKSNPFILPKITGTSSESAIATGASNFAPGTTPLISAYLPAVIFSTIRFPIYLGRTEKSAPVSAKTSSNIQKHTKIFSFVLQAIATLLFGYFAQISSYAFVGFKPFQTTLPSTFITYLFLSFK